MAENSKIEWCHHTANLWHGCTEVHAGCDNCYARVLSHRWKRELWGNDAPRMMIKSVWKDLARYQKLAAAADEMHRVFVGSMMDIFEKRMELVDSKGEMVTDGMHVYPTFTDALRDQLFEEISEGKYPNLLFLLLTKRPSNINKMIPESWKENPPSNVMFGTSPVDQKTADTLIPQLLQVKGKRFLSVEPMIGPVDITNKGLKNAYSVPTKYQEMNGKQVGIEWTDPGDSFIGAIDWVICGGESGPKRRPINLDWARSLRDQCAASNTPFFMKQVDKVIPIPEDLMIRQFNRLDLV